MEGKGTAGGRRKTSDKQRDRECRRRAGRRTEGRRDTGRARKRDRGAERQKRHQESGVTDKWDGEHESGTKGKGGEGKGKGERKGEGGTEGRGQSKARTGNAPESLRNRGL